MNQFARTASLSMVLFSMTSVLATEPTEADYNRFREFLVGTWNWETQGFSGTITFTLSPTKRCLTSYASTDGGPVMHAIEGYDAEKNSWKRVLFWAEGGHAIAHTKIDASAARKSLNGLTLKGNVHDVDSDGGARDSKVTYRIVDKNKWEVHRQDGTIVYTRQKKK